MAEIHYLISDASKKVDVEAHVLRYWEEELELSIPRNEMGHRYYTDFHIRLFRQVKMLKEKGYQLKAIKAALAKSLESGGKVIIPNEVLEEDVIAALKETGIGDQDMKEQTENGRKKSGQAQAESGEPRVTEDREDADRAGRAGGAGEEPGERTSLASFDEDSIEAILAGEKMEQFQRIMNHIIGRAMEENSEKLSQDISYLVHDKLMKEMDYLMRVADEKEEERFKQIDELIRAYQRDSQSHLEAAASVSKLPFFRFKKKKFGRNGNKLF